MSEDYSSYRSRDRNLLPKLKQHVVQVEALVLYTLFAGCALLLVFQVAATFKLDFLRWLAPCATLIPLGRIVTVTNPPNTARDRLNWAAIIGGSLGAVGGAAADIFSGGLTLAQGTLIGFGGGAAIGAAIGDKIERWRNRKDLLERGEAFELLYDKRRQNPKLANPGLINKALDNGIPFYDINSDGRKWYALDDLKQFIKQK
jgi:hypothetical protein